ncbi:similar to Saccharomyces cerevisiae YPR085C ASA1 Putative protein of unknown function [Maudiozyma saulgeensis]|uniref:Uncharacterized protein n=1 Tax=Maudiozyma saulgeensis TaxID=1789683 RepID=A0A1X7QY80_9SACH|nr:similar to Saccharomyces cerevisiae YPR085C ASA1 Putative protein of unknown function [Kazachstania saulgeensis]
MNAIDKHSPTHILRSHKSRVTSLVLHSDHEYGSEPILLSGDENGVIIIWNAITRRPLNKIQLPADVQVIDLHYLDDKIMVLSKDHSLRIYTNFVETFEMKVNTLNFANISIFPNSQENEYTMVCCNTSNSENIDIYNFFDGKMNSLSRLFNSVSFMDFIGMHSLLGRDFGKMGILMKIIRDDTRGIIFCGYESGTIIGFKIANTKFATFEKNSYIKVILLSKFHYPNPILDITLDVEKGILLSSSTEKQLEEIDYKHCNLFQDTQNIDDYFIDINQNIIMNKELWSESYVTNAIKTNHGKISHLCLLKDQIVYSTWSGKTVVIDRATNVEKDLFWTSRSRVAVSESSQGNIDPNRSKLINKDPKFEKIGAMAVFDPLVTDLSALSQKKNLISPKLRRLEQYVHQSWCYVGYNNGNIAAYRI